MWADADKVKRTLKEKGTKNLYWCHEKGEWCGLWVVATSRGRAKELFAAEIEIDFCDVRCTLHKKDVGDIAEGCIDDDRIAAKLGVTYEEDEDE